jgi:glycosyltransferase involved in cell wall biosynthesis
VNVTLLSDLLIPPLTGVGRYAYELTANLRRHPAHITMSFVSYRGEDTWSDIERRVSRIPSAPGRTRWRAAQVRTGFVNTAAGALAYAAATQFQYARLASRFAHSVVHAPTLQVMPEARLCQARVVTVHDASHIINSSWHPAQRVKRLGVALGELATVNRVIVVSQATADALIQQNLLHADALSVIHNGISPLFDSMRGLCEDAARRGVVCVSTVEPRKNIDTLLRAYSTLPISVLNDHPLTLIGEYGWQSRETHSRIQSCQAAGWLRYAGYVSDLELAAMYARARLSVYPSLYEGFGLPVLEAFAVGTPVIAGNHSSIPEVSGGHAHLLHDVTDVDEMREAILTHLRSPWDTRTEQARVQYSGQFTWERAAAQTIDVYRQVLAQAKE